MPDKKPPTMSRSKKRRGKTRMADMGSYPGSQPAGPGGKCPSCGKKMAAGKKHRCY